MKVGLNSESMQRANRHLIIGILLENKSVSRIELSKRTNLNRATITNIINEFLAAGIVREEGFQKEREGRKAEGLCLFCPEAAVLSARLTREFFEIGAFSIDGDMRFREHCPIDKNEDIQSIMRLLFLEIDAAVQRVGEENVLGLSVGVPGPYLRGKRNVAVVSEFEQLGRIDFQRELEEHYPFYVITEHDSQLSALAEWKRLPPETRMEENSLVAIQSIGIGIGSGMIINGKIFHGATGIAGEVGHMGINFNGASQGAGRRGIFEAYASTGAVRQYVLERMYEFPESTLTDTCDYKQIREAYFNDDPLAACAMDNLAWKLAYGLSNIVYTINPSRIVLSEDYPRCPRFIHRVRDGMGKMIYPELMETTVLRYSEIEIDTTLLGGHYLVLDSMLKQDLLMDRLKAIAEPEKIYLDERLGKHKECCGCGQAM